MSTKSFWSNWFYLAAVFTAASTLGGFIKIPSPVGSIALDSAPGYFLACYVHPLLGGIVGAIGHLASAASAGFPLGFVHVWVSLQMFFWCFAFGSITFLINRLWAYIPAALIAILLNGVVGPLMLAYLDIVPMSLAKAIIPILLVASAVNVFIAILASSFLAKSSRNKKIE